MRTGLLKSVAAVLLASTGLGGGATAPLDGAGYGQSNWGGHVTTAASPPAANPNTYVWDNNTSAFATPVGNGARTLLNALNNATGRTCRLVSGGMTGVNIEQLQKGYGNSGAGTDYYEQWIARIVASGITPRFLYFHHGEGNANAAADANENGYQDQMDQIHTDFCADLGLTKAQCPMIISSIARVNEVSFGQPDSKWHAVQKAQATVNARYPNIYYSHSNVDADLNVVDQTHYQGAAYGRSGARYAQTALVLLGLQSLMPRWFATAAERVSATTTRITVAHVLGTDFTPTSAITGWELSNDNGATYVTSAGVREDATHILLTHADLGTLERKARYQYGKFPTITGAVHDNSALAAPLNFTLDDLVAAGTAPLPTPTYSTSKPASSGTTQAATGFTVPGSSQALMVVVGHTIGSSETEYAPTNPCTITAQPSGTAVTGILAVKREATGGTDPCGAIWRAQMPVGTTSVDVSIAMNKEPFGAGRIHVSSVPIANLVSQTPTGTGVNRVANTATISTTVATDEGGFIFAIADQVFGSTSAAITGDNTFVERNESTAQGGLHVMADASNVADSSASNVTCTFSSATNSAILAAAWR